MTTAAAHLFEGAVSGTADRCRLRWGLREGAVAGTPMEARPWRLFGRPARATDAGKVRRHLPAVLSPAEIPRRPTKEVVWPKRHGPTRICSTWHRGRHILLRDAGLSSSRARRETDMPQRYRMPAGCDTELWSLVKAHAGRD